MRRCRLWPKISSFAFAPGHGAPKRLTRRRLSDYEATNARDESICTSQASYYSLRLQWKGLYLICIHSLLLWCWLSDRHFFCHHFPTVRQAGTVTKMPQTNPARAAMRRPRALTIATATGLCCCLFLDSSSVVGVSAATASSVSREVSSR